MEMTNSLKRFVEIDVISKVKDDPRDILMYYVSA